MSELIDIADLDVVYLSYDEPQKEEFWVKIQNIVPWAVGVDGVKGSDAAHKAAAEASTTDRFILIDGDNLPDPEFFNKQLEIKNADYEKAVYRWRARNHVNGLMYGNGGLSSWTRDFALNMKTHENSTGDDAHNVEFCFDPYYWPMHDCYSTTYPNGSAFHAWRAGFREGVKMVLDRGKKPTDLEFKEKAHARNLDHLNIWHNVGRDVEFGIYAILGARLGTMRTLLTPWDFTEVQDFDKLAHIWQTEVAMIPGEMLEKVVEQIGQQLKTRLGLNIIELDSNASKFFKYHYMSSWKNLGTTVREGMIE